MSKDKPEKSEKTAPAAELYPIGGTYIGPEGSGRILSLDGHTLKIRAPTGVKEIEV